MALLPSSLIFFLLDAVWTSIQNIRNNEELSLRIQKFGFGEEALTKGETLYGTAEGLEQSHNTIYAKQHQQYTIVMDKFDDFYAYYMGYAKVVRRRLKRDKNALEILGLRGPRKKMTIKVIEQARQFFNNVISDQDIFAKVSDLGISAETMQTGHEKITALIDAIAVQDEYKSDAQNMTVEKHNAFSILNDYWMELREALINSTKDKPQLLERAKIPAYSPEYLRRKRAKSKAAAKAAADSQTGDPDPAANEPEQPIDPAAVEEPVEDPPTTDPQQVNDGTAGSGQ